MCLRISPPLQKDLHGQFLRAGLVMNNPANDAGNALIVSTKNRIESFAATYLHLASFGHASCVHIPRTNETRGLWQGL